MNTKSFFSLTRRAFLPALFLISCTPLIAQQPPKPKPLPVVKEEHTQVMRTFIGTKLTATPKKARKILVFSRCEGYVHGEGIVYGNALLELAGKTGAYDVQFSTDYADLTNTASLAQYDALVINNATQLKTKDHPTLAAALTDYVKAGHGLCAIHAAADSFYQAPEVAEMIGGLFDGHPWGGGGTWAMKLDDPDHVLNRTLKTVPLKFGDEIYQQKSPPYDRQKLHVLVSLDLSDKATAAAKKQKREDKDYAVSWIRSYGKGRVFYTSFGHDKRAFLNPATAWHILDGLQYTLGDLDVKTTK